MAPVLWLPDACLNRGCQGQSHYWRDASGYERGFRIRILFRLAKRTTVSIIEVCNHLQSMGVDCKQSKISQDWEDKDNG